MKEYRINDGISIIIITFNRKKDLEHTLSLLGDLECDHPWEVIIIDQNSSDGTDELFAIERKNVTYVSLTKNLGVAGGRNVGVKHAQYEYMVFIDDDANFTQNNALNKIYNMMTDNPDFGLFAFRINNLDGGLYNWPYGKEKLKKSKEQFICKFFIGCGHGVKKSFFDKVGGYSDELFFWGEETELILKSIACNRQAVFYDGTIEILHRVKGNGRNANSGRFYYQVRNRLYIIRNMYPKIAMPIFELYYRIGYLIKAIKNGWLAEYNNGIKDSSLMTPSIKQRLGIRQLIRYVKL